MVLGRLVGFGIKKERIEFENFKKPKTWLRNCLTHKTYFKKNLKINFNISEQEILLMGLRLNKGIDLKKSKIHRF